MPVGDSADDVARQLAAFVNDRGGKMTADSLAQFYARHPSAKAKMTGGVKEFCDAHPDLLRFETKENSTDVLHAASALISSRVAAERLHRFVASNGGDMHAGTCFAQFYAEFPGVKAVLKCGAAQTCSDHPDLLRYIKDASGGRVLTIRLRSGESKTGASSGSQRPTPPKNGASVAELLKEFVEQLGGKTNGGNITNFYDQHPWAKEIVDGAGGLRAFCDLHPTMLVLKTASGKHALICSATSASPKTELKAASLQSELHPKPSNDGANGKNSAGAASSGRPKTDDAAGDVAAAEQLRAFIRQRGGALDLSTLGKFYADHPSAQEVVKACGGLQKFCDLHRALLVLHTPAGAAHVIRLAQEVGAAAADRPASTANKSTDASGATSVGRPTSAGDGGSVGIGPNPWARNADPWSASAGGTVGGSMGSSRPQGRAAEVTEPGDIGATAAAVGSHLASSAAVHVRDAAGGAEAAPSGAASAGGHGLSGGRGGASSPDGSAKNPRCGADVAAGTGLVLGHAGGTRDASGDFAVAERADVAPAFGRLPSGVATPCSGPLAGLVDVGARCFVLRDCSVFASTASWETLRGLRVGDEVTAAGAPEYADGYLMLPILPVGAVQLECLEIPEEPAPRAAHVTATAPKQFDVGCGHASVVAALSDDQQLGGPRGCEHAAGVPDDVAAPRPPAPKDVGELAAVCLAWEQSLLAREERSRRRLAALTLREEHLRRREEQLSQIEQAVAPQAAVASSPAWFYSFASDSDVEHVD